MSASRRYFKIVILLLIILAIMAAWKFYSPANIPASSEHLILSTPPEPLENERDPQSPETYTMKDKPVRGVPILMYHKISSDPKVGGLTYRVLPEDFEWQMRYLKDNGYHTVNLGDVYNFYHNGGGLPDKPVVITIDDGYKDNYYNAFPILKKYGHTATIFIVTNTVGGKNEFDTKVHLQPECEMLSWEEIREMDAAGITIGAHTLDHVHLARISVKEAERQLIESKKRLEQELNHEVKYFCYPYGEYSRSVLELVKKCGYLAATSVEPGLASSGQNPLLYSRIAVQGNFDHKRFIQELNRY